MYGPRGNEIWRECMCDDRRNPIVSFLFFVIRNLVVRHERNIGHNTRQIGCSEGMRIRYWVGETARARLVGVTIETGK